jgi:cation-transporting ATPase I
MTNGRAHIEVRGADRIGLEDFAIQLEKNLSRLAGVTRAELNTITGRVVVILEEDGPTLEDLIEEIESVEEDYGLAETNFPAARPEHPSDREPLRRQGLALGADLLGLGVSTLGQLAHLTPLPTEIASIVVLADSEPRLRHLLQSVVGPGPADLGLALANTTAQAFSQGPIGLLVDIAHRATLLAELSERRRLWEEREPELCTNERAERVEAIPTRDRPRRLPSGPVERYADRASIASIALFGAGLATTGNPRTAATAIVAGAPKAARLGREAFAAELDRQLAARKVLVMDQAALRRLDRVTTVVLDSAVLTSGRERLASVTPIGATATTDARARDRLVRIAAELFDRDRPTQLAQVGEWSLGPLPLLNTALPRGGSSRLRALRQGGVPVLGLRRDTEIAALVSLELELEAFAIELVATARRAGLRLAVAGSRGRVARQLGVEDHLAGGARLADAIREMQRAGEVVLLVSGGKTHAGLVAADLSIAVTGRHGDPPWGAHLLAGASLEPACLLLQATTAAKAASRRGVGLSLAGSGIGGIWSLAGIPQISGSRAAVPVNLAALSAQLSSTWSARELGRQPPLRLTAPTGPAWHTVSAAEALDLLHSDTGGLADREARRRRPPSPPPISKLRRLVRAVGDELANPLTPVLAVGAGLSAAVGSVTDAGLVAGVAGANAVIGAIQRLQTESSLDSLIAESAALVTVRRDGEAREIGHDRLVPGDVVDLSQGDVVPADCRILEVSACEVDESSLTGESLPVYKQVAPTPARAVGDRACMLFEGTTLVTGSALGVVVATGVATEARRGLAEAPDPPPSGVESRLGALTALTVPITIASGAAVTALGLLHGRRFSTALESGVSVTVAAVPEGLPLLASAAQLAAARRLSTKGALVRNPRTIEALGRVNTLCFDKTGTLTAGTIVLQRVSDGMVDEPLEALSGTRTEVLGAAMRASPEAVAGEILLHATDRAVVEGGLSAGVTPDTGTGSWDQVGELAFEPSRRYHAVVGRVGNTARVVAKGAPEAILPRCITWRSPAGVVSLDEEKMRIVTEEADRLARRGLRVLAVAERVASSNAVELGDERVSDLELLGFLGLADHVRPSAAAAVNDLRAAGVDVVMITGDHPSTAEAIAAELGILDGKRILSGPELENLSDDELRAVAREVSVFARVTPVHKVRIVAALQQAGRIVAMTGDGANDAPAIRLAHAGIALGRRGAPAAREAADLVVTDDRLETIIEAIVEGRAMWISVRDALAILVGGNLGEVGFAIATSAITGRSALGTRQLLLVNLLTDLVPAATIAVRPPVDRSAESLLNEGPDASLGGALARQVAIRAGATAAGATGAWAIARVTGRRRRASTISLIALVGTQLGQTAVLGKKSPLVLGASVASAAVLAGLVQTPVVSQFFGCTPLGPLGWSIAGGAAASATLGSVVLPRALPLAYRQLTGAARGRME